jgi:hypothetical protein
VALGEAFPERTIFGTRGRRLPREPLPRKLFPECCTRGRLPRVFLALPRVLQALGEAGGSCSVHMLTYIHSILQTHNSVSTQFERLIQQILEINELNTLLKDRSPTTQRIGPVKLFNKFKEMLYLSLDGCRRHVTFLIHDDEGSSKRQTYVSSLHDKESSLSTWSHGCHFPLW